MFKHLKNTWQGKRAGVVFVSYPKTGRTWLRVMIGRALILQFGLPEKKLLDCFWLTKKAGLAPLIFSHGGPFHLYDFRPFYKLQFSHQRFKGKKIIFLIRDIRDTLVSLYFQESKRAKTFKGSISDFIRDDVFGAKKIIKFYNIWFEHQPRPEHFLLLRYEDLRRAPAQNLARLLNDLQGPDLGSRGTCPDSRGREIEQAVEFASFENMKKMERAGGFKSSILRPAKKTDKESFKVRRGKVHGFRDYLSPADVDYIDKAVKELGIKGCDWYYAQKEPSTIQPAG